MAELEDSRSNASGSFTGDDGCGASSVEFGDARDQAGGLCANAAASGDGPMNLDALLQLYHCMAASRGPHHQAARAEWVEVSKPMLLDNSLASRLFAIQQEEPQTESSVR